MKNIYEMLRQKATQFERLKKGLQALRIVASLLPAGSGAGGGSAGGTLSAV